MTEPIWMDDQNLSVRKTTSDDYYFLESTSDAIRPFLELKETQVFRYWERGSDTEALELRGYFLPVKMFELLKPFLTHFHDVLPPSTTSSDEAKQKRTEFSSGLETPAITREGRATVHQLSYQEIRLLALIFLKTREPEARRVYEPEDFEEAQLDLEITIDPIEESDVLDTLDTLVDDSPEFQDMYVRYATVRFADRVKSGDLLGLAFKAYNKNSDSPAYRYSQKTMRIYDGTSPEGQFVPLVFDKETDTWLLPPQFQVPLPFPLMWWEGLFEYEYHVNVNFSELACIMEYDKESELPREVMRYVDCLDHTGDVNIQAEAVLRFSWQNSTYRIFFVRTDGETRSIPYEEILEIIQNPKHRLYGVINETTLAIWVR